MKTVTYPPHNIVKVDENNYKVDIAVAGFTEDDITITLDNDVLTISGKQKSEDVKPTYLYKGIANRDFDLKFNLYNKFLKIDTVTMKDGILSINFVYEVPEDQLPKQIAIQKM
jgi:molecular chaperone IbpA